MNEWTNELMNTGMNQWVVIIEWTNEFIEKNPWWQSYEWTRNWMNEWTNQWMNEWINEWMNGWATNVKMNEQR